MSHAWKRLTLTQHVNKLNVCRTYVMRKSKKLAWLNGFRWLCSRSFGKSTHLAHFFQLCHHCIVLLSGILACSTSRAKAARPHALLHIPCRCGSAKRPTKSLQRECIREAPVLATTAHHDHCAPAWHWFCWQAQRTWCSKTLSLLQWWLESCRWYYYVLRW